MPSATERRIAELTKGMLRLKLFVIFSSGKGLDLKPYLADHLTYMIELERRGVLFASGPFVTNGIRTFTIQAWTVMEGSLNVTVNFSDRSSKIG